MKSAARRLLLSCKPNRLVALALTMALLGVASRAQEISEPVDAAAPTVDTNAPAAENVATTNQTELPRDPFWPVGYEPPPEVPEPEEDPAEDVPELPPVLIQWPQLELKGVTTSSDGRVIALLSGVGLVEKGDVVVQKKKGVRYSWRITTVAPGKLEYEKLTADPIRPKDSAEEEP